MTQRRKDLIHALLKGIETGDPASVAVVNQEKYIQHNPQTAEGGEGLEVLFKRLAKTSPRVNIVRIFSDGDFVFAHTAYDFSTSRVGFEIFRFEGDQAVEHWDNIQVRRGPNGAGHTMVDGSTQVTDLDQTERNRNLVRSFVATVLTQRHLNELEAYIDEGNFIDHNPRLAGLAELREALANSENDKSIRYERLHRVLAEGNFVLAVSEGALNGVHTSFFDLFRIADGRVVEHWDTTEAIPPRSEWKNQNGKF